MSFRTWCIIVVAMFMAAVLGVEGGTELEP